MTKRLAWLALPFAALATPAVAQQQDTQLWTQINTNVPIDDGLRITLEQIARFSDRQDGLYQTEFGALLGVRAAKGVELGFGYRKVGAHNGNTGADEDRIRQQVVATFGPVTTRFRIDERINPRGAEIGFRIRPLVRYNYKIGTHGYALFVSHESFYLPNATSWGQRRGYERMRNIVGVLVPIGKQMVADVGYLNQYRPGRDGARGQMDHALTLQLTINLRDLSLPHLHD
ncbi:DUF2490 domain-containing protein [Sphingomonas sp. RP10(2022)]|uniref:DUF2490 domain-containing protein n=1 Tax=Sphingomonas liriopis TaxID=2949094 RepID=A0A9X2KQX9_9SPHN|nr:DUF2490 domain-containing protein [Sphingomonas liriopis]MCP3735447.1 DUF2490 domain-containing protein [Sphingomonas liriopis]